MNGVPLGAADPVLPWARILQRNATLPGLGGQTGLERRNSALWRGFLREEPGTERRIFVTLDRSVRWPQVAMIPGCEVNVPPMR